MSGSNPVGCLPYEDPHAKKLTADEAGKEAIGRRESWTILLVDSRSAVIVEAEKGLDAEEAHEWWSTWDHEGSGAAAVPWPESLPIPRSLQGVRAKGPDKEAAATDQG